MEDAADLSRSSPLGHENPSASSCEVRSACEELVREHMQEVVFQLLGSAGASSMRCGAFEVHASDISGDMNHVYRVSVTPTGNSAGPASCVNPCTQLRSNVSTPGTTPASASGDAEVGGIREEEEEEEEGEGLQDEEGFSVIVKISPSDVPYLREEEKITVDPKKIELEYEVLSKFRQLQQDSVPRTYLLDRQRKAIIMEDMVGYRTLTGVLTSTDAGLAAGVLGGVERAGRFVGRMHRETWLASMNMGEREKAMDQFGNPSMRCLMSTLLFDKPFDPHSTNHCSPLLLPQVEAMRGDSKVREKVARLKRAFLTQDDCLCHGDLATDNILLRSEEFRIIDCEFSGIGLRAYDLALLLQMTLYQLLQHHQCERTLEAGHAYQVVEAALRGYGRGVGQQEMMRDPVFVDQVCSLIACEFFWTRCSLDGDVTGEDHMLSLSRRFLLHSDCGQSIQWNIREHLRRELGAGLGQSLGLSWEEQQQTTALS